jgi:valyl-tRNA synthetase
MPFLTEDLWGATAARGKLLAHAGWPVYGAELVDPAAEAEMRWAISLIEGVRSVRAQMNVPAGLYVPVLQLEADSAARSAWARNQVLIRRLARIDSLTETTEVPKGAITVPTAGATFALPLASIIDVGAEKVRLAKAIEKLGKELGGLRGRLGNANFVASAPAEVVAEARANLDRREEEEAQLKAALARLAEIG